MNAFAVTHEFPRRTVSCHATPFVPGSPRAQANVKPDDNGAASQKKSLASWNSLGLPETALLMLAELLDLVPATWHRRACVLMTLRSPSSAS